MARTLADLTERVRVLVLPGLAASDRSTIALRAALSAQGHRVHGWELGTNPGPTPAVRAAIRKRLFDLAEREGGPIALVGWSLGGVFAHRLAQFAPNMVRSVVAMGSPLGHDGAPSPLEVPCTSIYSQRDSVVPWRLSLLDDSADRHENIEVHSLHFTFGFDPSVMLIVSDRLRSHPDRWRPFRPPPFTTGLFPADRVRS